jgi:hypothetical protein
MPQAWRRGSRAIANVPNPAELRMQTVALPRDAFLGATKMIGWRAVAGRISAEMICPYPSGIPITAPGERLTAEVVDYLESLAAAGVMVEGASDQTLTSSAWSPKRSTHLQRSPEPKPTLTQLNPHESRSARSINFPRIISPSAPSSRCSRPTALIPISPPRSTCLTSHPSQPAIPSSR